MTSTDFLLRVQAVPDVTTVRIWYEDLAKQLISAVGSEEWFWVAAAWAVTQEQQLSPMNGMSLVGAYLAGRSHGEVELADTAHILHREAIRTEIAQLIESHEPPKRDIGALFFDLTDALLGKTTRTVMGDDPLGGSPVPIDLWAYRDVGFVDIEYLRYLTTNFGEEQTKDVVIDEQGEEQYEFAVDFYTSLALEVNSSGFLGIDDWRPYQLQAVGRHAIQRLMGVTPVWPKDLISVLRAN